MDPSECFVIISINCMLCLIIVITVIIVVTYQNVYLVLRCPLLLLFVLRQSEFVSLLKRGLVEGFAQLEQLLDLHFDLIDNLLADLAGLLHLVV